MEYGIKDWKVITTSVGYDIQYDGLTVAQLFNDDGVVNLAFIKAPTEGRFGKNGVFVPGRKDEYWQYFEFNKIETTKEGRLLAAMKKLDEAVKEIKEIQSV